MDIFAQSLIALGGWLVALIMFILTQRQKTIDTQNVLVRAKIDSILSLLEDFGELVALYRYFDNRSGYIEKDKDGNFVKDESGEFVTVDKLMELDPDYEKAMQDIENQDIKGAITIKKMQIRRGYNKANDLAHEFDSSGELSKKLEWLYLNSVNSIEFSIKHKNLEGLHRNINKADISRRELRLELEKIWEHTINKSQKWNPLKK